MGRNKHDRRGHDVLAPSRLHFEPYVGRLKPEDKESPIVPLVRHGCGTKYLASDFEGIRRHRCDPQEKRKALKAMRVANELARNPNGKKKKSTRKNEAVIEPSENAMAEKYEVQELAEDLEVLDHLEELDGLDNDMDWPEWEDQDYGEA